LKPIKSSVDGEKPVTELTVDDVNIRVLETDVPIFLSWIREGHRPLYFICGNNCGFKGTAKLDDADFASASKGEKISLECPKCRKEFVLRIPENSHELTKEILEPAYSRIVTLKKAIIDSEKKESWRQTTLTPSGRSKSAP
jgi:hypothetical protein